jgi:hypothetical protein
VPPSENDTYKIEGGGMIFIIKAPYSCVAKHMKRTVAICVIIVHHVDNSCKNEAFAADGV